MPTLPTGEPRLRLHLLRRHGRRRPARAHRCPHRRGAWRRRRQSLPGRRVRPRRDRPGRRRNASTSAQGEIAIAASVVVNAAGVWADEVRRLEDGTLPDTIRPAKGVHLTLPWSLLRNDIAAVIPVPGDQRSLFVVPWGRQPGRHVHAHLHRHDRHRLQGASGRSAVHRGRHRLCPRRGQCGDRRRPHCRRRHRRVGRSAPAGALGVERAHRRPVAPPPRDDRARRCRRRDRREADDLPGDGGGHRRRGRRPARTTEPGAGRDGCHCSAPRDSSRQNPERRPPTSGIATAPWPRRSTNWWPPTPASPSRSCPASHTFAPRRCTPPATRWRRRSTTCSPGAPAPTCSIASPRSPRRPDVAELLANELGWDAAERERQLADYHDLVAREQAEVR